VVRSLLGHALPIFYLKMETVIAFTIAGSILLRLGIEPVTLILIIPGSSPGALAVCAEN
jgi:hypothetical protein